MTVTLVPQKAYTTRNIHMKYKKSVSSYSLNTPPQSATKNLALDHVMSENKLSRKTGSR